MMYSYFCSFLKENKFKITILMLSLSLYYSFVILATILNQGVPEIARIPLKSIGVETIVQKTGKIPGQMLGAIFPHSNAPVYQNDLENLEKLRFVEKLDSGIYFWFFDANFFKSLLGIRTDSTIFSDILKSNILQGEFVLEKNQVLITEGFSKKNKIPLHGIVQVSDISLRVAGILKSNLKGNIVPADIYLDRETALKITKSSVEMNKIYDLERDFTNVVLLKTDPSWKGDKDTLIKKLDPDFLVFSENTFTDEILGQLKLISFSGKIMFALIGVLLVLAFSVLIVFNLKTREQDIAILRMLGWKIQDLKRQFIGESLFILLGAILIGNAFVAGGIQFLQKQTIRMELPWDISAKPHFLPEENNIERIIEAPLPVNYDAFTVGIVSIVFFILFFVICWTIFNRVKKVNPAEFSI